MGFGLSTRRELAARLLPMLTVLNVCARPGTSFAEAGAQSAREKTLGAAKNNGLAHNCECIHQEVAIRTSRDRIYRALTDARQFKDLTELSYHDTATEIATDVGGPFSIFGGLIIGRHIEMVPNELLVQAWRERPWPAGIYSIARFKLQDTQSGTKIIFDHTGFPQGAGEHLASGWKSHYWEPLQKYLS